MSTASDILDPVEAAKDDIDRSKRLIAQTLDDLTLHHSWLETYHRDERRRAQRLQREEALARLELRRQRAVWTVRRAASIAYEAAQLTVTFLAANGLALASWAAPRANCAARSAYTALKRSSLWTWRRARLLSVRSAQAIGTGFVWSVHASERTGLVFRRKTRRLVYLRVAPLGFAAGRALSHRSALPRKRIAVLWMRTRIKTHRLTTRAWRRMAPMWTGPKPLAGWIAIARRGARGWTRMQVKAHRRGAHLRMQLKAAATEAARKAAWSRPARRGAVSLVRTRRAAVALEARLAESLIRTGPRIRRLLARYTPARFETRAQTRALIVRPCTALVCVASHPGLAPTPHEA